jgi:hypothetical protein
VIMLTGITITGADDQVDPRELAMLSAEFPFVEWGILMSESRAGTSRYPGQTWMLHLDDLAKHCARANEAVSA